MNGALDTPLQKQRGMDMQPILIYMHTEDPFMLNNIQQSAHFFSYYHHTALKGLMTMETTVDGIVYIFKDKRAFEAMHHPATPHMLDQIARAIDPKQPHGFKSFPTIREIPNTKKVVSCDILNLPMEYVYGVLNNYYRSIHPDIHLFKRREYIDIVFENQMSLYQLMAFTYGSIEILHFDEILPQLMQNLPQ